MKALMDAHSQLVELVDVLTEEAYACGKSAPLLSAVAHLKEAARIVVDHGAPHGRQPTGDTVLAHTEQWSGRAITVFRRSTPFGAFLSAYVDGQLVRRGPMLSVDDAVAMAREWAAEGGKR